MVDSVLFPVTAFGAPFGATVVLTDECVARIEALETRTVRIIIRPGLISPGFYVVGSVKPFRMFPLVRFQPLNCSWTERDHARVEVRIIKSSNVGANHQQKEDKIKNKNGNGGPVCA